MGATEARGGTGSAGRRRFVTRHHVEDAALAGTPIVVTGRDVVTDEAAQRAEDLGVRIERDAPRAAAPRAASPSPSAERVVPAAVGAEPTTEALRKAVHKAVVAELGREPEGLAEVIDTVMRRRGR